MKKVISLLLLLSVVSSASALLTMTSEEGTREAMRDTIGDRETMEKQGLLGRRNDKRRFVGQEMAVAGDEDFALREEVGDTSPRETLTLREELGDVAL